MPRPKKNLFRLGLNDKKNIVDLRIHATSAEVAVKIYEQLELWLIKAHEVDLENQKGSTNLGSRECQSRESAPNALFGQYS